MKNLKTYKAIYFIGMTFFFIGAYRLFKEQTYGTLLFSVGVLLYAGVQLLLLFQQLKNSWYLFQYLKFSVNILLLISVAILVFTNYPYWYYPLIGAMFLDFFANIFRRMQK